MKQPTKWIVWALALTILTFAATSCQPTEPTTVQTTEESSLVVGLEGETENASTEATAEIAPEPTQTAPATPEPVVLENALTTESGLQYLEVEAGDGPTPQAGDIILMNVIGSLPDGTEIVNTHQQGQPVSAIMGREQLLPGWEEGVSLMKAGGSAKLVLPPELAFGEEGYGIIPPNSQIVMDVELLSVEPPPVPTNISADDLSTTESGLQFFDITLGEGVEVEEGSTVITHYTIWVKGEPEDTFIVSSSNNQPITFVVGNMDIVFPGWNEGVVGMKPGGKRLLVIPPELALGESGGGDIPPNATLVMEIELMEQTSPIKMSEVNEEDYVTTESGLKYYDLEEGDGPTPETGQTVVVHYHGWLQDGTMFDSSIERGQPFSFVLGEGSVISGWEEGLATMAVGGRRQLVVPPELGYGEAGAGAIIPPGATIIFEVELLEIRE